MEHRNVSYPFQSPPCWFYGSQKWERTRDPLAKRAGECLVISYFLEHGIWLFGCGCRQGCEWEYMPRECIPLLSQNCDTAGFCKKVHKSFFQTACRVQTEPRSLLPVTGPCRRLAQELWHDCKGRALSVTQLCDGQYLVSSEPVAQSQVISSLRAPLLNRANWTFASMKTSVFQFPLPFELRSNLDSFSHKGEVLLITAGTPHCHVFSAKFSSLSSLKQWFLGQHKLWALSQRLNAMKWVIRGVPLHVN